MPRLRCNGYLHTDNNEYVEIIKLPGDIPDCRVLNTTLLLSTIHKDPSSTTVNGDNGSVHSYGNSMNHEPSMAPSSPTSLTNPPDPLIQTPSHPSSIQEMNHSEYPTSMSDTMMYNKTTTDNSMSSGRPASMNMNPMPIQEQMNTTPAPNPINAKPSADTYSNSRDYLISSMNQCIISLVSFLMVRWSAYGSILQCP